VKDADKLVPKYSRIGHPSVDELIAARPDLSTWPERPAGNGWFRSWLRQSWSSGHFSQSGAKSASIGYTCFWIVLSWRLRPMISLWNGRGNGECSWKRPSHRKCRCLHCGDCLAVRCYVADP